MEMDRDKLFLKMNIVTNKIEKLIKEKTAYKYQIRLFKVKLEKIELGYKIKKASLTDDELKLRILSDEEFETTNNAMSILECQAEDVDSRILNLERELKNIEVMLSVYCTEIACELDDCFEDENPNGNENEAWRRN